ncbi:pre-toxin TG domain-containing protein [Streptomyces sp. Je 1-369]|uniref:pre-toxin TG domain-containing protein n=1 Tax=Streptomyces sp. Je 1-369 TaxID=2966192 RepID=UPI002286CD95|nr:pre-toxin TG domain-containing protein [Streptomyces sp. Je 1-369]WAL95985.1 pre-toxin TG domain-containing protein [Streptomyces sp. Je 1-369]
MTEERMQHRTTTRLVTTVAALSLSFTSAVAAGTPAAAAEKKPASLLEIAERVSHYAHCDDLGLLEKADCLKEFGRKALIAGVGTALFLYGTQSVMKDHGARFKTLDTELEALGKLKLAELKDPSSTSDPKEQEKILTQAVKTAKAAKPHLVNLAKNVAKADEMMGTASDSLYALSILTVVVGDYGFPPSREVEPIKDTTDWGKELRELNAAFDQMNKGFAQMDRALKTMNEGVDDVNAGLAKANKGIAKANKGMKQMNDGIAQANRGMKTANKHVPGIKKGAERLSELPDIDFDFSHVGDSWGTGSSGLDEATQQRRMSLFLDLVPGIGDGKGIVEALTGKDLATGKELSGAERAAGSLAVLRWLKVGAKVGAKALTADDVRKARKGGSTAVACASNSFLPGTPVLMADGSAVPIEQVREGDLVLATEPGTGTTQGQPVTDLIVGDGEKNLVKVDVDVDGDSGDRTASLTATDLHPFWTGGELDQWTNATDLATGMTLRTDAGAPARIDAVTSWTAPAQEVRNLTVAGAHTYYVLAGDTPVLVHNAAPCKIITSAVGKDSQLSKAAQQAGKNQAVQRDLDGLFEQLSRGNMNPGLGSKALAGTDITYARGRNGGRLFFRNVEGGIEIVGKSDKGNESKVIARLKQLYGK